MFCALSHKAWKKISGVRARGQSAPRHFSLGKFLLASRKRELKQGKKWKWRKIEGTSKEKREGGKLKMEEGKVTNKMQYEDRETFFLAFHFSKPLKFVSTNMEIFYQEKAFNVGGKIRKNNCTPSEKYSSCASEKVVCLPFSDRPKISENKGSAFFFFFFLIFNFAFSNKNVKIKCQNI